MKDTINKAAFFDFDLTITKYDSFKLFLWFYYFLYKIKLSQWVYLLFIFLQKKIGIKNLFETKGKMLFGLKNMTKSDIRKIGKKYLERYQSKLFYQSAVDRINKHLNKGEYVFIITSSPDIFFNQIKEILRITNYYANDLEYNDEVFTGKMIGFDVFGNNKAALIRKIAEENRINLEKSYSYSDSHTDIPMLAVVGNPTAVNPDKILRKHAQKSNWNIEEWH